MKSRQLGCHHLFLPNGQQVDMAVVEVDEEGRYVTHHSLCGEEPFVEWVGGTLRVKNVIGGPKGYTLFVEEE